MCVTMLTMDSKVVVPDLAEACDAQRRDVQRVRRLLDQPRPALLVPGQQSVEDERGEVWVKLKHHSARSHTAAPKSQ